MLFFNVQSINITCVMWAKLLSDDWEYEHKHYVEVCQIYIFNIMSLVIMFKFMYDLNKLLWSSSKRP